MGLLTGPSLPKAPDYTTLAKTQAGLGQDAINDQTTANRANQTNPGGSLTWTQDPTTGQWTQRVSLSPTAQGQYNTLNTDATKALGLFTPGPINTSGMQGWSTGGAGTPVSTAGLQNWSTTGSGPINNVGLTNWGDATKLQGMTGFGNVKEVQDAMMAQLQPGLTSSRNSEIARLKAQGLTEGSEAWNNAVRLLGTNENDASQKALLAGVSAYGDIFNRQLSANQYSDALRGAQLGERTTIADQNLQGSDFLNRLRESQLGERLALSDQGMQQGDYLNNLRKNQFNEAATQHQMPLSDYEALTKNLGNLQPNFGTYATAGVAAPPDLVGAASQTYADDIARYNAEQAATLGRINAAGDLINAGSNIDWGGLVKTIGGWFG